MKPSPEIFQAILSKYHVETILYVDDNERYHLLLQGIPKTHAIVYQNDGIYLFKKKVLFPIISDKSDPEFK